jgi:hypothetical protein
MSGEIVYSALRDNIIRNMTVAQPVPVDFSEEEKVPNSIIIEQATKLGLLNQLCCRSLEIPARAELKSIVDRISAKAPASDNTVSFNLNGDTEAVGWIMANCVCDASGDRLFMETDLPKIKSNFEALCYFMCWAVMFTNGFFRKAQQDLVGNSDGTGN